MDVPQMPEEFKGDFRSSNGFTNSVPREWTDEEISWIYDMKKKGYSLTDIAKSIGRTAVSISIKLKRIGKKEYNYNSDHILDKYNANKIFFDIVKPKNILDLYCGLESWWEFNTEDCFVSTNDKNEKSNSIFHEDAEKLIHKLYYNNNKYDVIDLDPFGSAFECFDLAIKMAKHGIVITFGEFGHKRFKRLDYVRRYYGIESLDDFTIERLIKEVQKIGERNKKMLNPVIVKEWRNIARVYFTISNIKITEQWKNGEI